VQVGRPGNVQGGKPDGAPEPLAARHRAIARVGAAQQNIRRVDAPLGQQGADARAADRLAVAVDARRADHVQPEFFRLGHEHRHVAAPTAAEAPVFADIHGVQRRQIRAQMRQQALRLDGRERPVERLHDHRRHAEREQRGDATLAIHDEPHRIVGTEEPARMRVEGQHRRHAAAAPRGTHRRVDHRLVAEVNTVEHPDGQMQRTPVGERGGGS
jgi:hypothetical protein